MEKLQKHALSVELDSGYLIQIPGLRDLIAMKVHALNSGDAKRWKKDGPDIVQLVIKAGMDPEQELKPICLEFGSEEIYDRILTMFKDES